MMRAPYSPRETTEGSLHLQLWLAIKIDSRVPKPGSPSSADFALIEVEGRHTQPVTREHLAGQLLCYRLCPEIP